MIILVVAIICVLIYVLMSPYGRYYISHLPSCLYQSYLDIYDYIKHKKYNEFKDYGKIITYIASNNQAFGCGKTLTMVHDVMRIYNQYNDKFVFDYDKNIFVKQKVRIFSNVDLLSVPYIYFDGISQFARLEEYYKKPNTVYNECFGEHDIVIFAVDELGHVFNSRDFKENFSPETLTRMLQVRKHRVLWIGTSQRWGFIDKIIRETTTQVITCRKWWRLVLLQTFNAYDVEHAINTDMLKPIRQFIWFATDRDYNSYDTKQMVNSLDKQVREGYFIQTEDIIKSSGLGSSDLDIVSKKRLRTSRVPLLRRKL